MNKAKLFHKIGSWSLILFGMVHLTSYVFGPKTAELEAVLRAMMDLVIAVPGNDTTLFLFYEGYSLLMGGMLVGYGIAMLLLASGNSFDVLRRTHVPKLNVLVSLVAVAVAAVYFFSVAVVFTGISFASYVLAFGLAQRGPSTAEAGALR